MLDTLEGTDMTREQPPGAEVALSRHVSKDVAWHSSQVGMSGRIGLLRQEPATLAERNNTVDIHGSGTLWISLHPMGSGVLQPIMSS